MSLPHPADRIERVKLNSDANRTSFDKFTTTEKLLTLQRDLHLRSSNGARKVLVRCVAPGFTEQ